VKTLKAAGFGQTKVTYRSRKTDTTSWAISYGDMVTTLLCFFIIFYSLEKSFEHRKKSLQNKMVEQKTEIVKNKFDHAIEMLSEIPGVEVMKTSSFVDINFSKIVFFEKGKADLTNEGKKALVEVMGRLSEIEGNYLMEIQGHADQTKVRRIKQRWWVSNMELSVLRALSVQKFLSARMMKDKDLVVSGYGDLRNISENNGKGDDINRRIGLRIQFIK
jgi:chemotaxis protein MotB